MVRTSSLPNPSFFRNPSPPPACILSTHLSLAILFYIFRIIIDMIDVYISFVVFTTIVYY